MLERLDDIFTEYETLQGFSEWLHEKNIRICSDIAGNLLPVSDRHLENLLYEYFGIDPIQLEFERRELIANLQRQACENPMKPVPAAAQAAKPASEPNKIKNIKDFKDMMRSIKKPFKKSLGKNK